MKVGSNAYFWEIALYTGKSFGFSAREGVGAAITRERQWDFATEERAHVEYRQHVTCREAAYFRLVRTDPEDDQLMAAAAAIDATEVSSELEEAVRAAPDDPDAYLVYGDWLQLRGVLRGELVCVQAMRTMGNDDASLREREEALRVGHKDAWLGPLARHADTGRLHVTWRFGFIASATLRCAQLGLDALSASQELASLSPVPSIVRP